MGSPGQEWWWSAGEREFALPIRVNLDLMLVQRGMTLSELAERIGITLPNLSVLKTNKVRAIRFSTLEAICRELDCRPGDLLEHVQEGEQVERERSANVGDVSRQLVRLPPAPYTGRGHSWVAAPCVWDSEARY